MSAREQQNGDCRPLAGPPPAEVPLANAPLVRVIAQVRFPIIASVSRQEFIGPFQEAIRERYPVARARFQRSTVVGQPGETNIFSSWSFHEATGPWRVVLATNHVTLETDEYSSRDEFMSRLEHVLRALHEKIGPKTVDRLGVRYVDRVTGPNVSELSVLIRPEVAGVLGTPLRGWVQHSITESFFNLPDGSGQLAARWGYLPPNTTTYPTAISAIDKESWILDLDVYRTTPTQLEVDELLAEARMFTERLYSVFRWVVTDEFLERYGSEQ